MRFTTEAENNYKAVVLLSIKQRYKLNAIHNIIEFNNKQVYTIVNKAKIQIECDSQLILYLSL